MRCRYLAALMVVGLLPLASAPLFAADPKPKPAPPTPKQGIEGAEVITRSGKYAVCYLNITTGAAKTVQTWQYMGGMRDGKMELHNMVGVREAGGSVEVKADRLVGKIEIRGEARQRQANWGLVDIDASIAGGKIDGTVKLGEAQGKLTGYIVDEAELAKNNAVPKNIAWPMFQGPIGGGMAATSTNTPTVDELSQVQLRWRCEEWDVGRGMGNINRFMSGWGSASQIRTGTGSSSHLAVNGRIYLRYYVPAPASEGAKELPNPNYGGTQSTRLQAMLEEAKKDKNFTGDALPLYAAEKMYQNADDVLLCMDAATGKTIFKTVVRGRGLNWQHHKAGPFNVSPAYGNGKIFFQSNSGLLFAVDAENGKLLWEFQAQHDGSNALVTVGNYVIAPMNNQFGAFDQNTGELKWTANGGRAVSCLTPWTKDGKHYLIGWRGAGHAPQGVACIDVETGQDVWHEKDMFVHTGGRGLGPGGIAIAGDIMIINRIYPDPTWKKGDPVKPRVSALEAFTLSTDKIQPLWKVDTSAKPVPAAAAGAMPAKADDEEAGPGREANIQESNPVTVLGKFVFTPNLQTIDLKTGKEVARLANGIRPGNGGYTMVNNDLVFVRQDGTHGGMVMGIYKISPDGQIKDLTAAGGWSPPVGGSTTSYHHPIYYPIIDGRFFARQNDGIYCWDFRAAK